MELTIADKLNILLELQAFDSKLDEIHKLRGDLPDEVADMENELAGFEKRISRYESEVDEIESEISNYRLNKKDADKLIAKYKDQQMNVRNNREYDAISKELELQELEIQLADKRIKECEFKIKQKQGEIDLINDKVNSIKKGLVEKKKELDSLIKDSEEEEKKIMKQREKHATSVEPRLLTAYERIRGGAKNGLAVVSIDRGACGGCFNVVPPQRQADIMEKTKIIVCEHCGRILADADTIQVHKSRR